MKTKIMLKIENKRLKRRVSELESQIENINKWNIEHLITLQDELFNLLKVVNNDKSKTIIADYPAPLVNRDNVQ